MITYTPKIKTKRNIFGKRQVIAYGYKIVFLSAKASRKGKPFFMIVDPSILCAIEFESLKAAIRTAKANEGTKITRSTKLVKVEA